MQEEIAAANTPEVIHKLVDFIKERRSWRGSATELLDELGDQSVGANVITKYVNQYKNSLLLDEGIVYGYNRTHADGRILSFEICDSCDGCGSKEEKGFIFCPSDKPINTYNAIEKAIKKYCRDLGIDERSPHKERKTFTSALINKGVSINTTRQLAGHVDERTTLNNYCFDRSEEDEKLAQITYALSS